MWIRWVIGEIDLLPTEVWILNTIGDVGCVSNLLYIALGGLQLTGYCVGHTGAAKDGAADQCGDEAARKAPGHYPEGPAQVEGVLRVAARADVLILWVKDKEPSVTNKGLFFNINKYTRYIHVL